MSCQRQVANNNFVKKQFLAQFCDANMLYSKHLHKNYNFENVFLSILTFSPFFY